jgi:hypothetical protein
MSNPIVIIMEKKEEDKGQELNDLEKFTMAHIKVVDKLTSDIHDDDPVLLRKKQQILKSFYETPLPEEVLKRIGKIE